MRIPFRRTSLILAALWIAAAHYYWRTAILLPPDRVFEFPPGKVFRGFAANGDAVLLTVVRSGTHPERRKEVGPIEFWRLPELVKIREAFSANDEFDSPHPDALGRVVVFREGTAWLAKFDTGELLEELPGVEPNASMRRMINDRLLWIREQTAVVYDLTSKRVLASYPRQLAIGHVTSTLCTLIGAAPSFGGGFSPGDRLLLNTTTGQPDHRFESQFLGPLEGIHLSADGRIAAISTPTTLAVCEVTSAKRLWSIPRPTKEGGRFRFENDATVLAMDYLDEWKASRTTRWRVADGSVIDPPPPWSAPGLNRTEDRLGNYAVDQRFFEKERYLYVFELGVSRLQRWLGGRPDGVTPSRSIWELRDVKADRPIGVCSDDFCGVVFVPDGSGFIAATNADFDERRWRYYRLPPRRDWWWFVRWGLLPPIVLLALRWSISRVRRVELPVAG